MFEIILWSISKIYEEIKDSFNRSGEVYEEIGGESAEFLTSLLGLNTIVEEETPCMP